MAPVRQSASVTAWSIRQTTRAHRDDQLCAAQRRRDAPEQVRQGGRDPGRGVALGKTPTCLYLALHLACVRRTIRSPKRISRRAIFPTSCWRTRKKIFALTIEPA